MLLTVGLNSLTEARTLRGALAKFICDLRKNCIVEELSFFMSGKNTESIFDSKALDYERAWL